jgi:hypothetical protein
MKSPLLPIADAALVAGMTTWSLRRNSHFGTLVVIRDERGRLHVREAELRRWMSERAAACVRKREQAERRRREKAERYDRWLKRQGLMKIPQCADV